MPSFPLGLVGEISPDRIVLTGLALIALRWLAIVAIADARRRVTVADARAGIGPARQPRELGEQFLESEEQPEEERPARRPRSAADTRRRR